MSVNSIPTLPTINFTSLAVLDLSDNIFDSSMPSWIFNLRNIVVLYLKGCRFRGSISSHPQNITSLKELDLSLNNLCELMDLDLSFNNFNGNVSEVFESLSVCGPDRIQSLSLGSNNLSGLLTEDVGNFKNLTHLDLSANSISGPIPVSLGNLSGLMELLIYDNQFNGTLPETIGQLKMLANLDMSYNFFKGVVSEVHFTYLTKLKHFVAAGNSLTLKTSQDWLPPFQLKRLWLDYWHLGREFPKWLQSQRQLILLSLPNTGISDTIPAWFSNISSQLRALNLSHNQLHGKIDNIAVWPQSSIDLSSNQFNGPLPSVSSTVVSLDLSNSSFSGSLFHFLCDRMDEPKSLSFLYLGDNLLTGNIPDCLMNWKYLTVLNLKSNNLTGNIPSSIGYLQRLTSLQLHNNHLSGELPLSMKNCTDLLVVDLNKNKFGGSLPIWMGNNLSYLKVLNIRSNKLQGIIPYELCYLKYLQILDLAHNNLSGTIPRCFHNFSAMAAFPNPEKIVSLGEYWMDNVNLVTKGREMDYERRMLRMVASMDLSDNMIHGEIPGELTGLLGLQSLNLSENLLTGGIPLQIGNMKWLESIDFSTNQLDGQIPPSMISLTFLSRLNLSYNNLTGQIPKSTQLQSLDQSSFVGNELCGPPLNKNCSENGVKPPTVEQNRGYNLLEDDWFYLSLGLGFLVGFWSVLGSLLVNLPWSIFLSRLLNCLVLKLYALIVEWI